MSSGSTKKPKSISPRPGKKRAVIDTSDIPEWTDEDFADSMRLEGRPLAEALELYRARKSVITVRIDRDVLAWLKGKGSGYQTRLNAILKQAMREEIGAKKRC